MGDRIRARRELHRWSIRHAASRAGISHTSWSRIERGQQRTDRYMVVDLAAALECSVVELTGQPYAPADRRLDAARIDAERVWREMMRHPLTERSVRPQAVPVRQESMLVRDLYNRCDYAGALHRLVSLIPDLHAGKDRREATKMMVPVYGVAMGCLLNVGYPAHAWLAADQCATAAQELEDPAGLAVAAANQARVLSYSGAYGPAMATCDRAADDLQRELSAPSALDLLGFLHLARAHHSAGLRDLASAEAHLAEAARIAERTGETDAWDMAWGPTNVALWQMALQLDTARPGEAIETARRVNVADLPAVRQVYFYMDMARALLDAGRPHDAVRMLLTAERVGPQHTRSSSAARETTRSLLRQGTAGSELRGLCERMGVLG
ncbi:helix-turn-helix domain-containing protein [Plantactinospora alkalitolerans]|uniref:helix-turn-helix domain-containing protein n=1 Tax=Plantactinospora alkalitolerans TaxID=2789879 RepID=UPI002B1EAD26|nr:helix-turn-helix transcriptional regulator [Plantactinospora alkalitolerans]